MKKIKHPIRVGVIWNYYGGVYIAEHDGKYYWTISGIDYELDDIRAWQEVNGALFTELLKLRR
jgi:hypothetical protein